MSEPIQGALAALVDRVASEPPESAEGGDFFARIPDSLLKNQTVTASELRTLGGIDRCCRGEAQTDARDYQIAEASGQTVPTAQRNLKRLRIKGIILCIGRTCRRIIRMIFGCKSRTDAPTPLKSDGSSAPQLPSKVMGVTIKNEDNSHQIRRQFPSEMMASSKGKGESPKARSSPTSPEAGGSTTTAKKGETPPTSAPLPDARPLIEARAADAEESDARDAEAEARWSALDPETRGSIEADVQSAYPDVPLRPRFLKGLCIAEMDRRSSVPATEASPVDRLPAVAEPLCPVEVLPMERQLRFQLAMLGSDELEMRTAAFADLKLCGRGDLIPVGYNPFTGRINGKTGRRTPREAIGRSPQTVSIGPPPAVRS